MGVNLYSHIFNTVSQSLMWNKARVKCFVGLVQAIIHKRTVNLRELTVSQPGNALTSSHYRKFQRFFEKFEMPLPDVSRLILAKIPQPLQGYTLSMDRTNWKLGKRHINILTIGVHVGKVCVPLVWKVLPQSSKNGNSNKSQRIELVSKLLDVMPSDAIKVLLMDREFLGKQWLGWLNQQGVHYVLRIKHNTVVGNKLADEHGKSRGRKPAMVQKIWGLDLFFACKPIQRSGGQRLYVVSNHYGGKEALALYRQRWGIELLFSNLKKRGFDLEETHLTEDTKLERLMAVVSLSFLFTYGWGLHLRSLEKQTAHIKRQSDFRYGLDSIEEMLFMPHGQRNYREEFYSWLQHGKLVSVGENFVV